MQKCKPHPCCSETDHLIQVAFISKTDSKIESKTTGSGALSSSSLIFFKICSLPPWCSSKAFADVLSLIEEPFLYLPPHPLLHLAMVSMLLFLWWPGSPISNWIHSALHRCRAMEFKLLIIESCDHRKRRVGAPAPRQEDSLV